MMENTFSIRDNVLRIQNEISEVCIKSGRKIETVQLMAVSKFNTVEKMQEAYDAGLHLFGENRVQEFLSKKEFFEKNIESHCHLIGQLQKNKVKYLPEITDFIQSVDSISLAQEINKQYSKNNSIANVLLEINIGNEKSKSGIPKIETLETIYRLAEFENIKVKGLMCIPPICEGDEVRKHFYEMNKLFIDIKGKNIDNISMNTLSMGMSSDYKLAIEEGSTLVRVGTGIFGKRNYNKN